MTDTTKLTLFFHRMPLGVLEKTENGYRYTSYADNEQELRDLLIAHDYTLFGSFKREKKELFPEFKEILKSCSREDIRKDAGIDPHDSMWEKLVKLSILDFLTPNLYVQRAPDIGDERGCHV